MKAKSNAKPKVLVILATLGERTALLKETLESISKQQVPYDLVMIYPFSSKETAKLAKTYGAKSIEDPGGMSAAVNEGIKSAKQWHKYFTWIGDDDLLSEECLKSAVKVLDGNDNRVVAYGNLNYINPDGQLIFRNRIGKLAPLIISWGPNLMPLPGSVFRTTAVKRVGYFDTTLKYSMDLDLFLRLKRIGTFCHTGKVHASFRWHPTSTTVANREKILIETEFVKNRYLPKIVRPFSFLWDIPVRLATKIAAQRVNKLALQLNKSKIQAR